MRNLRSLILLFSFAGLVSNAYAQVDLSETGDEQMLDWELPELEDVEEKPLHRERKNILFFQYSPAQYCFEGVTPYLRFDEFSMGWKRSIPVSEGLPLFVEAGALAKYSYSNGDKAHNDASFHVLTFKIPAALAYKFYLSKTRDLALIPWAGVNARSIAFAREKLNGTNTNLMSKNATNQTGVRWKSLQVGWDVGLKFQAGDWQVGVSYGRDFPDDSKHPHVHECGAMVAYTF